MGGEEEGRRFETYYTHPNHGPGGKATANGELRRHRNPCASAIVEHLQSSGEQVVPVRRSPEEEDTNFYIDVSHDLLETGTGIVPGIVYRVQVKRSPGVQIRDFYIESLAGDPYRYDPIGQFTARAGSGDDPQMPPGDADTMPRSTWIDDMELDWLHHAFATRQQQQQHTLLSDTGQRVIFGDPFPAYFDADRDPAGDAEAGVDGSSEYEAGRRRRPPSAGRSHRRCPRNVWKRDAMFEEQASVSWTVPEPKGAGAHDESVNDSSS
uniref:Uncharacterized protein n=1 Tax=Anopheles dirus TaxID=7168 RepID=A0A182NW47_9DIPT